MGGFGALDMMNKSLKNNKALLGEKKRLKVLYAELDKVKSSKVFIKNDPTPEELIKELRKKLKREGIIRLLKLSILLISISGIIGFIALYWIY